LQLRLSARTVANFCANRLAGELSAVVELCRLFPEIANNENTLGKHLHNLTATR
jgi:hypothetical protein